MSEPYGGGRAAYAWPGGTAALVYLAFAATAPGAVWGAEWTIESSVTTGANLTDNLRLVEEGAEVDAGGSVSATASVRRAAPTFDTGLTGSVALDRFIRDGQLGTDLSLAYDLTYITRLSTFSLNTNFAIQPTRSSEIQDSGNLGGDTLRTSYGASGSWTQALTPTQSLFATVGLQETRFDSGGFSDSRNLNVGTGWNYQFSPRLTSSLSLNGARFENLGAITSDSSSTDSFGLQTSLSHDLSQRLSFDVNAGVRWVSSDRTTANSPSGSDAGGSIGFTAGFGLGYEIDRLAAISLAYSRAIEPSSLGDVVERDNVSASFSYQLSRLVSVGLGGALVRNQDPDPDGDASQDRLFYSITPSLAWQMGRYWSLTASYTFQAQDQGASGAFVTSNGVFVGVTYQPEATTLSD